MPAVMSDRKKFFTNRQFSQKLKGFHTITLQITLVYSQKLQVGCW